ncbi:antitoxin [Allosphingosinicella sp.]|jgi:antitoxin VapB|uniref:antitoxin n=1 Tax=Allosphingosinicella sp. TaxID=2823234 RepID=UPI002EE4C04C
MTKVANSRTFRSGNSVAVRIPKEFGLPENVEVEIAGDGRAITIRRTPKMTPRELVEELRRIGPPPDGVQEREPIEWPERPGL